jgi:hypothetical protein
MTDADVEPYMLAWDGCEATFAEIVKKLEVLGQCLEGDIRKRRSILSAGVTAPLFGSRAVALIHLSSPLSCLLLDGEHPTSRLVNLSSVKITCCELSRSRPVNKFYAALRILSRISCGSREGSPR